MDALIFGKYTVWQLLNVGLAVLFILIVYMTLKAFLKKKEKSPHYQATVCSHCGWQGEVSVYAGKCPRCNRPLGDRKIDEGF